MLVRNRARNEWGVAYPSPLVMLSVLAVAMAGIAFVVTRDQPETERQITPGGGVGVDADRDADRDPDPDTAEAPEAGRPARQGLRRGLQQHQHLRSRR